MNNTLLFLGCGHSEAIESYNNSAIVLTDEGNLLIDCGYTIKHALKAQNLSIADIDAIFITHVHGDHVFGLERVAYEALFKYKKKIKLIFHESLYTELWDQTLKGSLGMIGEGPAEFSDYFDLKILKESSFELFGNRYSLIPVQHTPNKPAYGLIINDDILYTSDTIAIPDIVLDKNFRIGFHDVTLTDWNPVHATLSEMREKYPKEFRGKLYLMHYQDNWKGFEENINSDFLGLVKQGMRFPF